MSRAYRIKVRESMKRILRAQDQVSTQLELLDLLPCEEMAQLLAEELERRGFLKKGNVLERKQVGLALEIEPVSGMVTLRAEASENVRLAREMTGRTYDDAGPGEARAKALLKEQLRHGMEKEVRQRAAQLQTQVTDHLESELGALRQELDQVVNRVTAEALKRKAAQIGQIKQMTEDPQSGSLTIVLEV